MAPLAVVAFQVTCVLVIGLATARRLRHRAAALRHLVLITTLAAAAVVPLVSLVLPPWLTVPAAPQQRAVTTVEVRTAPVPTAGTLPTSADETRRPPAGDVTTLMVVAWVTGTVVGLLRLARQLWAVLALKRRSFVTHDHPWTALLSDTRARLGLVTAVSLRVAPDDEPVASWGWWRPTLVVPGAAATWDTPQAESVLVHELAHVMRRDWLRFVLMELIRAVYWWHPLVWIAIREARVLAEQACDDVVLRHHAQPSQYADLLITLARTTSPPRSPVVTAIAHTSSLERRITAMFDTTVDHAPVALRTRCLVTAPLLALSLLVASAAARADATNGTLTGTVRPDGGQALADVEVVLTAAGREDVRVRTDASGAFSLDLAPGTYRAAVRVPAFKRFEAMVDVKAGERVTREFALALGALTERISVAGEPDMEAIAVNLRPDIPFVSQIGVVSIPRRIDDQRSPAYPRALREARVKGVVKAAGRVGPDGHVTDITILESPHPGLSEVVSQYMTTMRYAPTKVQGTPVSTELVVTIDFQPEP
ncbi:M56 family metallopeptidase [Luteitalea sp.]